MKAVILIALTCMLGHLQEIHAQEDKSKRPSPPAEVKAQINGANVAVYYSSPSVKGRQIWGSLVPYGKVWRTGANEATVFETDKEITIQGQKVAPGKYSLFTIPGKEEWTFILNSHWDQWGAYRYDMGKDLIRFRAVPEASPVFNERLRFDITDNDITLSWENLKVGFEISE